jgi:hypothetical protein
MNRHFGIKDLLRAVSLLFAALADIATLREAHERSTTASRRNRRSKLRCPWCGGPRATTR